MKARGCGALFPEWEPYTKPNGDLRWGQPLSKSWQYLKRKIGIKRQNVTAYSARHLFADFVDSTDMSQRSRQRIMGHSIKGDIPGGYGSKGRFTTKDLEKITTATSPEINFMVDTLLKAKAAADAGKLKVVKPWLQRNNWSKHYQEKFP